MVLRVAALSSITTSSKPEENTKNWSRRSPQQAGTKGGNTKENMNYPYEEHTTLIKMISQKMHLEWASVWGAKCKEFLKENDGFEGSV